MLINCLLLIVLVSNYINSSCLFLHKTFQMWSSTWTQTGGCTRLMDEYQISLIGKWNDGLQRKFQLLSTPDQKAHLFILSSSHRGTVRRPKSKKELNSFRFCWPSLTPREAVNDFRCSAGLYWCSRKMTRVCAIKANIFTAPESGGGLSDTEEDNGGRVNGYRGGCRGPL